MAIIFRGHSLVSVFLGSAIATQSAMAAPVTFHTALPVAVGQRLDDPRELAKQVVLEISP